jgi:hypothetical protein
VSRRLRTVLVTLAVLVLSAGAVAHADELLGTPAGETLTGTAQADALYGDGGDDLLQGLGGDDDLDGGPGADTFAGGAGQDTVSYAGAGTGVTVTLDGRANDGAPGEDDRVGKDVEDVYGGDSDDVLTGDGGPNTLDGGEGNDTLNGGKGTDGLYGGEGDDVLESRDGQVDTVDCGPGDDLVDADAADIVTGCERKGRGKALPSARTPGVVGFDSSTSGARTTLSRLLVSDVQPATAGVRVICRGGGCPFGTRAFALTAGAVDLSPAFRGRRLSAGTQVVVLVAAPDTVGKYAGLTMRRKQAPKARYACVAPGATKAIKCP